MEGSFNSSIRRYYDLEVPDGAGRRGRWPLLIALHGYMGDKDSMMRVARRIAAGRMVVISLQGHHQFFHHQAGGSSDPKFLRVAFGWGTTYKMEEAIRLHHRAVRRLIRLAVRQHGADPERVFLLAFSQACAYNYRYVFSHPNEIRGAIGVCGGVPGDWHQNPLYRPARTHVLHIAATDDEWFSREKNLEHKHRLAERAASLDFRFYNSEHRFPRRSIPHIRKWIERYL